MTHKNREGRDYAPVAGSLQKNESHGGSVLGVALEPETWTDGLEPNDRVNHTHPGQDVTARTIDVDSDNWGTGGHGVEFLDEPRGGDVIYLSDKPDEVLLAELDDFERLNAYDAFFPEDYWGED